MIRINSRIPMPLAIAFWVWAILLGHLAPSLSAPFGAPQAITGTEVKYRMSRCSNHQLEFDSEGTLHATYWSGGLSTVPTSPSFIYYRNWRFGEGWSAQISIDDSSSDGSHLGGRHPSLTVDNRDAVWVTWHDHRNSTSAGNWIDNLEIYADFKPIGESFSNTDIRITNTGGGHLGDNGFAPKIADHPDGRVSIAWYDFGLQADIADLFLKTSDTSGNFDTNETLPEVRLTNKDNRGGAPSYSLPDLAVSSDGMSHLCWIGGLGAGENLYYTEAAEGGSPVTEILLKPDAADFYDPPHITLSSSGDVWIAYGDDAIHGIGNEDVVLFRRPSGQADFDPAIPLLIAPEREYAPDIEIDPEGLVHMVWIDERSGTHVYHAIFEPENLTLLSEEKLTETDANWARPSLAIDALGQAYVLWEEETGFNSGRIWFSTNAVGGSLPDPRSSHENWNLLR